MSSRKRPSVRCLTCYDTRSGHSTVWPERLLNELASAKACLRDPLSKQAIRPEPAVRARTSPDGRPRRMIQRRPHLASAPRPKGETTAQRPRRRQTGHGGSGPWRVTLRVTAGRTRVVSSSLLTTTRWSRAAIRSVQLCLDNDRHFSRHHFRLEIHPPICYLVDLNSRNGTFVNGQRVQEAFPEDGDTVSGGKTQIVVDRRE